VPHRAVHPLSACCFDWVYNLSVCSGVPPISPRSSIRYAAAAPLAPVFCGHRVPQTLSVPTPQPADCTDSVTERFCGRFQWVEPGRQAPRASLDAEETRAHARLRVHVAVCFPFRLASQTAAIHHCEHAARPDWLQPLADGRRQHGKRGWDSRGQFGDAEVSQRTVAHHEAGLCSFGSPS
jgi:hypothetical protein